MSQAQDTSVISAQPTSVVLQTNNAPAAPSNTSIWSTCWHAILPCVQIALQVGAAEAQVAIQDRLKDNSALTDEQKLAISNSVSNAIQNQGQITEKAINKIVDDHTNLHTVIAAFGADTAKNVASSSQVLLDVGSQEVQDIINAKLADKLTHAGLSSSAADQITKTIKASLATQTKLTEQSLEDMINNNITVFAAAKHYASDTLKNTSAIATEVVNIASDEGKHFIAQKLAGKLDNLNLTAKDSEALLNTINATLSTQTNLTDTLIEQTMNQQIGIFNSLKHFASSTASNVAASSQVLIDVANAVGQAQLKSKLDDAFKDMNPELGKMMVNSIMLTAIKEGNLTEAALKNLIASHTQLAGSVADHINTQISEVTTEVIGHDIVNDNNTDLVVTGADNNIVSTL